MAHPQPHHAIAQHHPHPLTHHMTMPPPSSLPLPFAAGSRLAYRRSSSAPLPDAFDNIALPQLPQLHHHHHHPQQAHPQAHPHAAAHGQHPHHVPHMAGHGHVRSTSQSPTARRANPKLPKDQPYLPLPSVMRPAPPPMTMPQQQYWQDASPSPATTDFNGDMSLYGFRFPTPSTPYDTPYAVDPSCVVGPSQGGQQQQQPHSPSPTSLDNWNGGVPSSSHLPTLALPPVHGGYENQAYNGHAAHSPAPSSASSAAPVPPSPPPVFTHMHQHPHPHHGHAHHHTVSGTQFTNPFAPGAASFPAQPAPAESAPAPHEPATTTQQPAAQGSQPAPAGGQQPAQGGRPRSLSSPGRMSVCAQDPSSVFASLPQPQVAHPVAAGYGYAPEGYSNAWDAPAGLDPEVENMLSSLSALQGEQAPCGEPAFGGYGHSGLFGVEGFSFEPSYA